MERVGAPLFGVMGTAVAVGAAAFLVSGCGASADHSSAARPAPRLMRERKAERRKLRPAA